MVTMTTTTPVLTVEQFHDTLVCDREDTENHRKIQYTNNAGNKNANQSAPKTVEATANSDDEQQIQNGGGCWGNKKLTFAEILQKKSAAAAASQQQNQQQDSSISVSSTNSSSASSSQSSQATTPTTVNPAKTFLLGTPE